MMGRIFFKTEPDQLAFGIVPAFRRFDLHHARYHELVPVIAQIAARTTAPSVLDIGCGRGDAKRFADRAVPVARWTGVEIDREAADASLSAGYGSVVTGLDLDRETLPFADRSFDVVVANHVLEHLADAGGAVRDFYRLVKPGGALLLGVPMHLPPVAWLARLRHRLFGRRPRGHCHFFTMGSLRRLLRDHPVRRIWGFRIVSARRQLPLEDWEWFYRASVWLGARLPWLTTEVIVHVAGP